MVDKGFETDCKLLSGSELFNREWYLSKNPDVRKAGVDPVGHYLTRGWREGRMPSALFDGNAYLQANPDVKAAKLCPLLHYLKRGRLENRKLKCDSLRRETKSAKSTVDKSIIGGSNKQADAVFMKHRAIIAKSPLFDREWYLSKNPDVRKAGVDPAGHYLTRGWREGRMPSALFDGNAYLQANPDVKAAKVCPLLHYLKRGKLENRKLKCDSLRRETKSAKSTVDKSIIGGSNKQADAVFMKHRAVIAKSPLFDREWYLTKNPDVRKAGVDPAGHYLTRGWMEGRAPSSSFDGNAYLKANPDVKRAKLCPLLHYEKFGRQQGRALNCENTQKSLENSVKSVFGHARELQTDVFFSVIVASYNYQDYIKETLDSLINQTYRNFEVIVVDDGSKDGSVGVIKEYANQYDFIKLYQHENGENRGLVETVDLGVKVSKGEYIAFCESDDYWTVDHLDCINKQIKKTKGLVIVNNVQPFGDEDRTSVMAAVIEHRKQAIQRFDGRIPDQDFRGANYIVTFSAACVNAMLLKSCDISSCTRRQSLDWWIWRQVCYGNKIEFVDKVLTYWRLHESFSVKNATGELVESGKTSDDILDCFRNALDAVIKARTHMSSSALNSKLADFDVFKRIGLQKRKMDVCKQLSNADCKGVKFLYVTQTSRVERPILDPSSRYRCYHGAETILRKGGFANVVSASKFMQQPNYDYDVYVFHRPSASLLPLIESLRGLNKILIADYDDLIFGTKREAIQSSAYKNNSLSLDAATKVFANNLEGLVAFDYVSVSTEPLRDMVKRFNPTAVVATVHNFIPNSIFRLTEQSELLSKPKIDNSIIYCSGTWSHNKDFLIVSDILLDVLQKNESLQFVAMGVLKTDDRFSVCSRVYFHDVVDYWKLFSIMSSMKFAIAPLEQSVFNDCKSDVKFLEAAVAGVLLIASPSPDMKRVSDAHIVLPKDASEWEYYLKHLPELWSSEKVRENYEYVKQNCSENTFLSEFSCMFNERNENY